MLKIKNLSVTVNKKEILRKVNLRVKKGEVHALLGPNASGKSTLAYAMMGLPGYKVTGGEINFNGKDIKSLPIEERVKLGMTLAFQHPPAIRGVKLSKLLEKTSRQTVDVKEFSVNPDLLGREINVGFSGGEKKLSEIIQIIGLSPSFVIFDELDAGLDIKNLERLTSVIKNKLLDNAVSVLLITHRGNILRFLKPDVTHVMLAGEIVCSSRDWRKIWKTIVGCGYEKCKECKLPSG